jgi:hydroxymethylpyrimidine/phosphomethylpyrimidine kinase
MAAILTIAESNPSGVDGIQADLMIFERLGVKGVSVITAITAQQKSGAMSLMSVPQDILVSQLMSISDIKFDAIKVGMVTSTATARTVAWFLSKYKDIPIVINPVFLSQAGDVLMEKDAVLVFKEQLMPLATVVVVGAEGAGTLAEMRVSDIHTMEVAARRIHGVMKGFRPEGFGRYAILVVGGQLHDGSADLLYDGRNIFIVSAPEEKGMVRQGVYSSAISVYLARGLGFHVAANEARRYIESKPLFQD